MFQPHGIIIALPIKLGGNILFVSIEVFNTPLEYNMLLRCTWFYEMTAFFSSVFRLLHFPHQGKIITINKLMLYTPDLGSNEMYNVPFVSDTT